LTPYEAKNKILPIPNFFVLYIFVVQSYKNEYRNITEILLKVVLNTKVTFHTSHLNIHQCCKKKRKKKEKKKKTNFGHKL
jgi:hypothetical protein